MSSERDTPAKPKWICEFCFASLYVSVLPDSWALIWQSAVCPECQVKVPRDGGYNVVKGGAYAEGADILLGDDGAADLERAFGIEAGFWLRWETSWRDNPDARTPFADDSEYANWFGLNEPADAALLSQDDPNG